MGALGAPLGRLLGALGRLWALLDALGRSWGALGRVWDGFLEGLGWVWGGFGLVFAAGQLEFKFESSSI